MHARSARARQAAAKSPRTRLPTLTMDTQVWLPELGARFQARRTGRLTKEKCHREAHRIRRRTARATLSDASEPPNESTSSCFLHSSNAGPNDLTKQRKLLLQFQTALGGNPIR